MEKETTGACSDPTEEITFRIPCTLARRVAVYAADTQSTVTSVIIEAMDFFLRQGSK